MTVSYETAAHEKASNLRDRMMAGSVPAGFGGFALFAGCGRVAVLPRNRHQRYPNTRSLLSEILSVFERSGNGHMALLKCSIGKNANEPNVL
jgi:hypothetical protein